LAGVGRPARDSIELRVELLAVLVNVTRGRNLGQDDDLRAGFGRFFDDGDDSGMFCSRNPHPAYP
jgi:hypothetical protein